MHLHSDKGLHPTLFSAFHGLGGPRVLQEGPLLQELQGDQLADSSEVSWREQCNYDNHGAGAIKSFPTTVRLWQLIWQQ